MILNSYVKLPEGIDGIPSGKLRDNYGKLSFLLGKRTISTGPSSIAMFAEGNPTELELIQAMLASPPRRLFFKMKIISTRL